VSDGVRESSASWADLLRDCKRRGMTTPVLAVGDGALGFWKAIRDVFPTPRSSAVGGTRSATCSPRPESAHPAAKKTLAEIYNAENKAAAVKAAHTFATEYGAKWPKAVDRGGHATGRHVGQRELPGQVRLLDGGHGRTQTCRVGR
jgi:putative transposase